MSLSFPYRVVRGLLAPVIPFKLAGHEFLALPDSGAWLSVFEPSVADLVGLDIAPGVPLEIEGVGGPLHAFLHDLTIEVAGHAIPIRVAFSRKYRLPINLLGRDPFFRRFFVTFDEVGRRVILNPRGKAR